MSDNWSDEATKTWTPARPTRVELLEQHIAELERREALLTAAAITGRLLAIQAFASERNHTPEQSMSLAYARRVFEGASVALTDAGFPWTSEPTYQDDLSTGPDVAQ